MILTPEFVFLHEPKTGGTFVRHWIARATEARAARDARWARRLRQCPPPGEPRKHGTARDVPRRWRELPLVACARNPYERAVSQWEFAWWRRVADDLGPPELLRRHYPRFPELRFAEFLELTTRFSLPAFRNERWPDTLGPGLQTKQYLEFFGREPAATFARLDADYVGSPALEAALFPVRFLPLEDLALSLADLLLEHGYLERDLGELRGAVRLLPPEGGRAPGADWRDAFTPELRADFRAREALLFELFPRYDV